MSSENTEILFLSSETPLDELLSVLGDIKSGKSRVHCLKMCGVFYDEVISLVVDIIRTNTCVRVLQMHKTWLNDSTGVRIAEALKVNTNLYVLSFSSNSFEDRTGVAFAEALKVNHTIRSLNFHFNKLGYETGLAFGEALKINTSLLFMDLSYNKLGETGVVAIGEALKTNCALRKLDMSRTFSGDEPGVAFVEALKVNKSLKELNLFGNGLGNITGSSLVDALPCNRTLTSLDISASLSAGVVEKVSEALWSNYSLKSFYLTADSFRVRYPTIRGVIWRNCRVVPRVKGVIQRAWQECRWDPEYQMCWKVQLGNLKRDTGLDLTEKEPQPGE